MSDLERTPEVDPPDEVAGESVGDWQRLHPVSPFLRGGVMVLAFGGYFISQRLEELFGVRWGPEGPTPDDIGPSRFLWVVVAFLVFLALVVLYGWFSWRVAKFRIGSDRLEYRSGLLFKQHRQVRYDRIQSVDISRPLLARLFGLAQVVVQSAGGSDSQVELAYLTQSKALQVRDAVLSLIDDVTGPSGGSPAGPVGGQLGDLVGDHVGDRVGATAGGASAEGSGAYPSSLRESLRGDVAATRGRQVLRRITVPMGRFIASLLYHPISVIVLIMVPGALIGALLFPIAALPILAPLFFGAVVPHVGRFLKEANFSVEVESDRLRITHGLTDQRSNTVPIARIQAVEISQGWFWRWPDWWRMKVTIAGVAGENAESQTTALPVGTEDEVLDLAEIMLPGLDRQAVLVGMRGSGGETGFTGSSRRSAVFQPWAWRRNGYAVTDTALVIRRGRLARVVSLVPHARVQSLSIGQGPLDRACEIASVHLDLTSGPVSGLVVHLDTGEAQRLLIEQSSRSALARKRLRRPLPWEPTTAGSPAPAEATTEGSPQP